MLDLLVSCGAASGAGPTCTVHILKYFSISDWPVCLKAVDVHL